MYSDYLFMFCFVFDVVAHKHLPSARHTADSVVCLVITCGKSFAIISLNQEIVCSDNGSLTGGVV